MDKNKSDSKVNFIKPEDAKEKQFLKAMELKIACAFAIPSHLLIKKGGKQNCHT